LLKSILFYSIIYYRKNIPSKIEENVYIEYKKLSLALTQEFLASFYIFCSKSYFE